jgi:arsenite methyltransferase
MPGPADAVVKDAVVKRAVVARYDGLASCCGSLSCGDALARAEVARGEVLVDLGCGRGQDVIRAAGRVGPAGAAIGIDLSEEMLATARASVPPFLANVRFVRSDLAPLALDSGTADAVVSSCTINHAPDKLAVYREIHRVLRPGGRFVIADVVAEATLPEAVRNDPAAWAACYGGAVTEDEYLAAIRDAGFAAIEILERSDPYAKGGLLVRSITVRGFRT